MKTTIRNAEQWAAVCPNAVASASQAHIAFLIEDAKKDLAELFAEVERSQVLLQQQGDAAQSAPAGEREAAEVVAVEVLELLHEMVDLHERRGTVLTVQMEQLRALLASAEGVKDE